MSRESIGVAVIGCGDVATQWHLPAIAASVDVRLVACCDKDRERADRSARAFGAEIATQSLDGVLAHPEVQAVIVATPPWVTPEVSIAALRAGKDVLAEKPMALDVEKALAVQAVERSTDRFVQIGFVMRHGPLFGAIRRWISEGRLGGPLDFRIGIFDEPWDPVNNPDHYERIMTTLRYGSPCIHDGAHTMDHLHYLLDDRASYLAAWGRKTRPEFARPNLNMAVIEFSGGHRARVEIGWFLPTFPEGEWDIIGPNGMVIFRQSRCMVELHSELGTEVVSIDEEWIKSCFRHQLAVFSNAIRTRVVPHPGSAEGIASLVLSQHFERAMELPHQPLEVTYP